MSCRYSWWGGYGLPPDSEWAATRLRDGENWPQQELYAQYRRDSAALAALAARAKSEAGDNTLDPAWDAAWRRHYAAGVRLWRAKRYAAERIRWAS